MIAAIGAFDGFHRGHRTLLERAAGLSSGKNRPWSVVTFKRHPENILNEADFRLLFLPAEQELLRQYFAVPAVHRIMFTRAFANMLPGEFLDYIEARYGVTGIVVGADFRFGKDRCGTPEVLAGECRRRGWSLDVLPLLEYGGEPLSSSRIRAAVTAGDLLAAQEMLGYPFFCRSRVIEGDHRGRELGFPTANLEVLDEKVRPAEGVYAALVPCDGLWYAGAASIGRNPTFEGSRGMRFEVHLIGYEGDLYGRDLTVFMLRYIRGEKRFPSAEELRLQMTEDVKTAALVAEKELSGDKEIWKRFASLGSCSPSPSVL